MYLTQNATISNDDSSGNTNGFAVEYSSNNLLANDTASNDEGGMGASSGSGNVFINDSVYYNVEAFGLSSSPNNTLINNSIHDNLNDAVDLYFSDNTTLIGNTAYDNPRGGLYVMYSDATHATDNHFYNDCGYSFCLGEFHIGAINAPITVYLNNFTIDNPAGGFQGFTSINMTDTVDPYTEYMMRWASNPPGLPNGYQSFAQKSINITTVQGPVSIDSITWSWQDSELGGANVSSFKLWKYDSTNNWTDTQRRSQHQHEHTHIDQLGPRQHLRPLLQNGSLGPISNETSNATWSLYGTNVRTSPLYPRWGGNQSGNLTIAGGNISYADISATTLTARWAAFFGNVSGNILLGDDPSHVVYMWAWNPSDGGIVCASTNSTLSSFLVFPQCQRDRHCLELLRNGWRFSQQYIHRKELLHERRVGQRIRGRLC